MEKLFMSASIVVAIVLCIVGIVKLPFKNLKEKYRNLYKAIFTALSFVLSIVLSILNEVYILCGDVLSVDFAILISTVLAGVFSGYNGIYEGLGLKDLFKKIVENIKKARDISTHKKAIEYLSKIDNIDEAISILEERKNNQSNEV